ncbi:MAG: PSD1 and planctomycete cytochrome C domain-containing protein [Gemmataceae bacterium]
MKQTTLILVLLLATTGRTAFADDREDFFESKIRPVLVGTCFRCHGGTKTSGALRIDSREALLQGGDSGAAISLRTPESSLLVRAIQRQAGLAAMPPDKEAALRPDQVADFVAWIKAGAPWPARSAKFGAAKHWAFEPIREVPTPAVRDKAWVKTSIDPFIRSKQEAAGIDPAPATDRLTLIRRATFDLTGLPPTIDEVDAFLKDDSPHAYEALVDRLLQSPAYGEHWGRHWLDVVRYADTAGDTADYPVPQAWRYRNYVIDAFSADKPYDEFLREQIAGDVLANQRPDGKYAERVTATGYLAIARRFGFDSENYHHLTIQDTIDTLGQSVLGLSLGCARCHDHKFDPVTMRDYYGLYGIFDSSRYPFPGSEQKPKARSMMPLLPPSESLAKWQTFQTRVNQLSAKLERQKQSVPAVVLRSLTDIDGDFEMQAAAAGGSNGVIVPPWLYRGKVAVTSAAQSPFRNLYPLGKVGASVPVDAGEYVVKQTLYPRRSTANCSLLYVNIDFRVAAADTARSGVHRFSVGANDSLPAVEVLISSDAVSLRSGGVIERLGTLAPNQWQNLQLTLDLKRRSVSGRIGRPGVATEFTSKPMSPEWPGVIDTVAMDSHASRGTTLPALEFDNIGVQDTPIAPATVEPLTDDTIPDTVSLTDQLQALVGIDGDFELQTKDAPPTLPWSPGPNSVVKLTEASQSPYRNIFGPGRLGIHMPNRGEYDGFGQTLPKLTPDKNGRLFVGFDFRCRHKDAGDHGSWRYYLGHGPGNSAAVELFFNGSEFFRRSAGLRDVVCPLTIGEWYQVQLTLDLKAKTYSGTLTSHRSKAEFTGQFASGWDGSIDYSFFDSYGHIAGVRPSLDVDNFVIRDKALPSLDAPLMQAVESIENRRTRIAELRQLLADRKAHIEADKRELNRLLAEGPFAMTYGMAEGTPHNVRMQLRGEPDRPGVEVQRSFVAAIGGDPLPVDASGSGRLQLAQWLTCPDNPLTARVMANRIWQYHFGRGLVKTPNDFGVRGLAPTHPELLDHLANQFVRGGWSVKALHRLIMLSATYRQSSRNDDAPGKAKPLADTTDLYASFARRRLSAEEIRDAILDVSGERDSTPAHEHPFPTPIRWGYTQHAPFSAVYDHNRRSVYLMTQRIKRHPFLALFDGADPNATTALRQTTTVPTQALYFLNDPFVHAKAERWAGRLLTTIPNEAKQIDMAWRRALGRFPTDLERAEAGDFLAAYRAELRATHLDDVERRSLAAYLRTLLASNEFLHVD